MAEARPRYSADQSPPTPLSLPSGAPNPREGRRSLETYAALRHNRSVTSGEAPRTYCLTRPVDNERADLDRGHLAVRARAAVPRHHHPFPECDHVDLGRRLGNTREKYPEQQQHRKLESQTPLHNTSLEAANILNKVTAHI